MKFLFFLVLLPPIFLAWAFTLYDGKNRNEPLDPNVLLGTDCSFLDANSLNNIFDERPAGSELRNVASRVGWEFNTAGQWRQGSENCIWRSSNIDGLAVIIKAKKFAPKTLDDGTFLAPFVKDVDGFASIGTRVDCFRPADKAAILQTSNYGEGGIAMIWGLFGIHIHVVAEQESDPNNIDVRIDTELEAEWILGQHILKRLEAYREITPSLILSSGQREECL